MFGIKEITKGISSLQGLANNMDLSSYKIPPKKKAPNSYLASIVEEVNKWCYGEAGIKDQNCWRMWCGIGHKISPGVLKAKLDYVKSKGIKSPRYLLACCKIK